MLMTWNYNNHILKRFLEFGGLYYNEQPSNWQKKQRWNDNVKMCFGEQRKDKNTTKMCYGYNCAEGPNSNFVWEQNFNFDYLVEIYNIDHNY